MLAQSSQLAKINKISYKNCSAIILAAGRGSRFGAKKQELLLNGKPLYKIVLQKACKLLPREQIALVGDDIKGQDISGGESRSKSVQRGLSILPSDTRRVIILEAARPLVSIGQIEQLLGSTHPSTSFYTELVDSIIAKSGAILLDSDGTCGKDAKDIASPPPPVLPPKALASIDAQGIDTPATNSAILHKDASKALPRSSYCALQTPQAFDFSLLCAAYKSGHYLDTTDETSIMYDFYGIAPALYLGGQNLLKITYSYDFASILEMSKYNE